MTYPPAARRRRAGSDDTRRAKVAAEYAAPLPLGAAADDHDRWPEDRLQAEILSLAASLDAQLQARHAGRLLVHHETDSRKSPKGLPDLIVAGPRGQVFAELKRQSAKAQPTAEQAEWLATLKAGGATVFLWRPADWRDGTVQAELYRVAGVEQPARGALPFVSDDGQGGRRARCGCAIDAEGRIAAHDCILYRRGPTSKHY